MVKELYQACAPGDRCIVVDTHCGFCCNYSTINARYEQQYNAAFDKSCRKYTGNLCNCFDLSSYPSCVEGRCQLVPWPQGENSPPPPGVFPEEPEPEPDLKLPPPPQSGYPQFPARPAPQSAPEPVLEQEPAPDFTAPEPEPEPEPEPAPSFPPQDPYDSFGRQDEYDQDAYDDLEDLNEPFTPNDDLYAPLPENLPAPQGEDDLFKPIGGKPGESW